MAVSKQNYKKTIGDKDLFKESKLILLAHKNVNNGHFYL